MIVVCEWVKHTSSNQYTFQLEGAVSSLNSMAVQIADYDPLFWDILQ